LYGGKNLGMSIKMSGCVRALKNMLYWGKEKEEKWGKIYNAIALSY